MKWQELLSVNSGRFEINQLLFADDAALLVRMFHEHSVS